MFLKSTIQLFTILVLALAFAVPAASQGLSSTSWIKIGDSYPTGQPAPNDVGASHDSLVFGIHQNATYGVDSALGENSSPPDPPGFFLKFLSIPGRPSVWGFGLLKKDLRDFASTTKKDTFAIYIKDDDSLALLDQTSLTFEWPSADSLALRCDSMFLVNPSGKLFTGRIDMFAQSSLSLPPASYFFDVDQGLPVTHLVRVFRYGTKPPPFPDAVHQNDNTVPGVFALHQNFPNPFNPTTSFRFDVVQRANVTIAVYNVIGQKVATVLSETYAPGSYTATWNGTNDRGVSANSGVYFVRMTADAVDGQNGHFSALQKIVLMK